MHLHIFTVASRYMTGYSLNILSLYIRCTFIFYKILIHLQITNRAHFIATDEAFFSSKKMLISFVFLNKNICCGYSLEVPRRGTSNEYPQHMYSSRNQKNIMWIPHPPTLICSYAIPRLLKIYKRVTDEDSLVKTG